MDKIFVKGLAFPAIIGVYDWERTQPQTVRVDLQMAVDNRIAATTDSLSDALDYAKVAQRVQQIAAEGRFQLVETLAETLASKIHQEFGVEWLSVRITKPEALAEAEGVGVEIVRQFSSATGQARSGLV